MVNYGSAEVENFLYMNSVWPDLAQFCHFGKINFLAILWGFIYYLAKFWTLFGKKIMVHGKCSLLLFLNGQRLKNNLAISHTEREYDFLDIAA